MLFSKISVIMSKRWNMIVTFCGHRDFQETDEIKERLLRELLNLAEGNETLICYAGGYGSFDRFAARCVKDAQKTAKNIRNCLVIPYLTASLQKELKEQEGFFDEIIYPALENVPPRFAIIRRNEWMVEQADLVIGYIAHNFGGAARTWKYANRKDIPLINLSDDRSP